MIKESRIDMATKLLYSSKLTIDEIMYRVGYDNRSTFYRNFKEAKGMTPKEYRDGIKDNVLKTLS
jgi:AraC-like DNA-binding protein